MVKKTIKKKNVVKQVEKPSSIFFADYSHSKPTHFTPVTRPMFLAPEYNPNTLLKTMGVNVIDTKLTPEEQKKANKVFKKVDYSNIKDRGQIIDTAIDQVLGAEEDPNKRKQLETLLRMTNYMENKYGANNDAWNNKKTNFGFVELDKVAIDDLFKGKGLNNAYTKGQKNNFEYLKNFGLPTNQKDLEKLLLDNDPLANMVVSRLVYASNPKPLPDMNDQKAVFEYWLNDYNHRGALKHQTEKDLFKIFQKGYKTYNSPDYKPKLNVTPEGHAIIDDNMGQWAHPGEVTRIASNDITMKGVPYPVLGVGADGEQRMMYPNEEHTFNQGPVTEYPIMEAKDGGWLTKYERGGKSDYDMLGYATHHPLGALKHMINPEKFHGTDEYKRPNHMTFSDESKYSNTEHAGGHWEQLENGKWTFTPTEFNIENAGGPEKYQQWWDQTEGKDGNILILPQHKRGGVTYLNEYTTGGETYPVIDDIGDYGENGIWIPNWEAMAEQAKKLGAKTVRTKSGAIISFDNNWNPKSADDAPRMKDGGKALAEQQYLNSLVIEDLANNPRIAEINRQRQNLEARNKQMDFSDSIEKESLLQKLKAYSNKLSNDDEEDDNYYFHSSEDRPKEVVKDNYIYVNPGNKVTSSTQVDLPRVKPVNAVDDGIFLAFADAVAEYKELYPGSPIPKISSGIRTRAEQERLYANRANNPYPVAKPGTSKHELGQALDIVFTGGGSDLDYQRLEALMKPRGFKWLGDYDRVHFEVDPNYPKTTISDNGNILMTRQMPSTKLDINHPKPRSFAAGGPFLPGMSPLSPTTFMTPKQLKQANEVMTDIISFLPGGAGIGYVAGLPFTASDLVDDYTQGASTSETAADAVGLIPGIKYVKHLPASGLKKAATVIKDLKAVNNFINLFNLGKDMTDLTTPEKQAPLPGGDLAQVTISPKKKQNGGWLNNYK